ncbi:MAG: NAD-dependent epimerase/dehydratase family protein, partial [Acidobacteriota bacterium]
MIDSHGMAEDSSPAALSGRTVLVTGGTGFIARHLLRALGEAGARAHATTRGAAPDAFAEAPDARWHSLDLRQADEVSALVRRLEPEVIFHLASHVAGSRDVDLVLPTLEGNLLSTVNLLRAVASGGGGGP